MSTLTFIILGSQQGKLITVQVNVDGHNINFSNVNKEIYLKRNKTYQAPSKRTRLLSWLNKNGDYTKANGTPKQTPLPQTLRKAAKAAPKSVPGALSHGAMVLEVERQLLAKSYILVKRGTVIPMSICSHITKDEKGKLIEHGCGKKSMIGAFKESPEPKFIGVCYHRYDIHSSCVIVKVWGKDQALTWLNKQKTT